MMMMMLLCLMITSAEIAREDACKDAQSCGDLIEIPYPFSTKVSCGLPEFLLDCRNDTSLGPDKSSAFLNTSEEGRPLQVLSISAEYLLVNVTDRQLDVEDEQCRSSGNSSNFIQLPAYPGPYLLSNSNRFMTWNCGYAFYQTGIEYQINPERFIRLPNDTSSYGGCWSDCKYSEPETCNFISSSSSPRINSSAELEEQDYSTCCYATIPHPTRGLIVTAYPMVSNNSGAPCSVSSSFFYEGQKPYSTTFPLKLDWAIPYNNSLNETDIKKDPSFACSDNHSKIYLVPSVPGYSCACHDGFAGDGYKNGMGCIDIDECAQRTDNCETHEICINTEGNHTCNCYFSCQLVKQIIPLAVSLGAILTVILATISCYKWKQRRKYGYFVNNGGLQLEAMMSGGAKIYTIEELVEATSNFSPSNKVGSGGFGIVYKGILKKDNGRAVAIKKARHFSTDEGDRQSFLNEMAILTNINHRHIVRLLGCCVETRLPLLVYEYVSHGTLAECLHLKTAHLPWDKRIDIAIQAGNALGYLHSAASPPILHRDVKSANILLDENMDAKVADFGASRLIPDQQSHVSTVVQGTIGYIDPEYVQSMELTEKSDVYGFGVVLAELLTASKPTDHTRQGNDVSLAWMIVNKVSQGKVMEIVDPLMLQNEAGLEEAIVRTADLAVRCLALIGEKRPSMREVVEELYHIKNHKQSMDPLILTHLEDKGSMDNEAHWKLISNPNESMETTVKVTTSYFRLTGR